jgi:hypothetical protein
MTIVSSSLEKEIKTYGSGTYTHAVIKFLKQDKDKGDGWTQRYQIVNEYNCWTKIFPNEEVPVKVLYRYENKPMSAEKFIEMMSADKMDLREKWDNTTGITLIPVQCLNPAFNCCFRLLK